MSFNRSIKIATIIYFNNCCLSYKDCDNKCALKCGWESSENRCFFGVDADSMNFSEDLFYMKNRSVPYIFNILNNNACVDENDNLKCGKCIYNDKEELTCKLFKALNNMVKPGGLQ